MAEFCKECFIDKMGASKEDIEKIVMSTDDEVCEGCGDYDKYVSHIADYERTEKEQLINNIAKVCLDLGAVREHLEGMQAFGHGEEKASMIVGEDISLLRTILKTVRDKF